jgi:putative N6-adenine-specific DNA methylase
MDFEIFLSTAPGLETALYDEVKGKGFKRAAALKGGVSIQGGWPDVWRANLWLRGAARVLARIASFKVLHLQQLEARSNEIAWGDILQTDIPYRVEASCSKSRIYHSGAAAQRVANAIAQSLSTAACDEDAEITIMVRIEHDICTMSVDTSGALLHKRGFKARVNKAPMRENMAALFLQQCGYKGDEPVFDPMCGSGTFVIEAAEIAAKLNPGRGRSFAFERLKSFDQDAWNTMRAVKRDANQTIQIFGSDRDAGAIEMSRENAARADVAAYTSFTQKSIAEIEPPCHDNGLVIMNAPYGRRISDKKKLIPLYQTIGRVSTTRFTGWRAAIITDDPGLAKATGLSFLPQEDTVQHGGIRITLYQTGSLP